MAFKYKLPDGWKTLYGSILNLVLRKDKNLEDLEDKTAARENLGLANFIKDAIVENGVTTLIKSDNTSISLEAMSYTAGNGINIANDGKISVKSGVVNANNTDTYVPGSTLYAELRPAENGTVIQSSKSVARNLTLLDNNVKNAIKTITVANTSTASTLTYTKTDGTTKDVALKAYPVATSAEIVTGTKTTASSVTAKNLNTAIKSIAATQASSTISSKVKAAKAASGKNGYIQIDNIMVQWGKVASSSFTQESNKVATVSFSPAFTAAPYNIQLTQAGASSDSDMNIYAKNVKASGMQVFARKGENVGGIWWLAIGAC